MIWDAGIDFIQFLKTFWHLIDRRDHFLFVEWKDDTVFRWLNQWIQFIFKRLYIGDKIFCSQSSFFQYFLEIFISNNSFIR